MSRHQDRAPDRTHTGSGARRAGGEHRADAPERQERQGFYERQGSHERQERQGSHERPERHKPEDLDGNVVLDAHDDDWAWRRRIRANPSTHLMYRGAVALVGLVIVVAGLIAVPAPGPGWLIVFLGVSVWASEFEWAQQLLGWCKARLRDWNTWLQSQPWWVTALVAIATAALVAGVLWAYLAWQGAPGWLPDQAVTWLQTLPGISAR